MKSVTRARPARTVADSDPLLHNGWIYGHDAEYAISGGPAAR
ncbi:hypothetical protein [Streptomyces chartreusis]